MTSKSIGKIGEEIVTDLLPGAVHVNKIQEAALPYDLVWNDMRIDVKSTTLSKNDIAYFNIKISEKHQGIMLVFVLLKEPYKFWVEPYSNTVKTGRYFKDAISGDKLADILKLTPLPTAPITVKKRLSTTLNISPETKELIEKARQKVSKETGVRKLSAHAALVRILNLYISS